MAQKQLTQADVDALYAEWLQAAKEAACGGTPYVQLCWERFAKADDELNGPVHYDPNT